MPCRPAMPRPRDRNAMPRPCGRASTWSISRFEEFPGASAGWTIAGKGGKPVLSLSLAWAPDDLFVLMLDRQDISASRQAVLCEEYGRLAMMCRGPGFKAKADFSVGGESL